MTVKILDLFKDVDVTEEEYAVDIWPLNLGALTLVALTLGALTLEYPKFSPTL